MFTSFTIDPASIFQRSLKTFDLHNFNTCKISFDELFTLLRDKSLYSHPLTVCVKQDYIILHHLVEQKLRSLKVQICKLIVKICQRNLICREFMNRNKAIDYTDDFSRATKAHTVIQKEISPEDMAKHDHIHCAKCRGVSSMCAILAKSSNKI